MTQSGSEGHSSGSPPMGKLCGIDTPISGNRWTHYAISGNSNGCGRAARRLGKGGDVMAAPIDKRAVPEFDAYDCNYSDVVNRALAFFRLKVDFFTRAKVEYLLDTVET